MTKNKRTFMFLLCVVVGIFLTACAGVAVGKMEPGDDIVVNGPFVQFWSAPTVDLNLVAVRQPVGAYKFMEAYRAAQAIEQLQMQSGHFCSRP